MRPGLCFIVIILGLTSCSESKETLMQRYLVQGNDMARLRNNEEAERFFKAALALDSCFADAWNNLGTLYFSQRRFLPAVEQYSRAIECKPDYWEAWLNRSNARYEAHDYTSALADLKRVEEHKADTAALYFMQGAIYTRLRELDNALVAFRRAHQLDKANVEIVINQGTVFYYKREYDSARQILLKVLEQHSQEANAMNVLAMSEIEQKNYTAALTWLSQALGVEPANAYFLNNRGYVYLMTGQAELALEDINRSITIDPYNGWAYRNKGIYYLNTRRYAEALPMFQQAEKLDPLIDNLYPYLTEAYFQNKDMDQACKAYLQALKRGDSVSRKPCKE
jgi:tetratricopeptide (TPR) repeat protein